MSPFRRSGPPILEVLALAFFASVVWYIFFGIPAVVPVVFLFLAVGARIAHSWRQRS